MAILESKRKHAERAIECLWTERLPQWMSLMEDADFQTTLASWVPQLVLEQKAAIETDNYGWMSCIVIVQIIETHAARAREGGAV